MFDAFTENKDVWRDLNPFPHATTLNEHLLYLARDVKTKEAAFL
jgi:hypothetical protein